VSEVSLDQDNATSPRPDRDLAATPNTTHVHDPHLSLVEDHALPGSSGVTRRSGGTMKPGGQIETAAEIDHDPQVVGTVLVLSEGPAAIARSAHRATLARRWSSR
jgi:hypothetical protein